MGSESGKKPKGHKKLTPKQARDQLEQLLNKFDLKVEPLDELSSRIGKDSVICWQGSAINGPTPEE